MISSKLSFVATQAALKGGEMLRRGFGSLLEVKSKTSQHNIVTQYDHAVEKCVIGMIKETFPDHAFIAEESGLSKHKNAPVTWIIDPLDGTLNFAHNIPSFTISIGAYMNNKVVAGVIYQPMTNELFVAERSLGAYLNGQKLEVTKTRKIVNAVIAIGHSHGEKQRRKKSFINPFSQIFIKGSPIRDLGSAALHLAYLAAGRVDAFLAFRLSPWDIAAGALMVEEAGGQLSHFDGTPHGILEEGNLVATNGVLHKEFVKDLKI